MGPLGACGMINGKSYNLGYVQSSPQAAEDGSISILYQSGDRCGPTSHYSTRIILQCDDNPVSIPAPTRSPFPPSAANCFHRSFLTQSVAQQDLNGMHWDTVLVLIIRVLAALKAQHTKIDLKNKKSLPVMEHRSTFIKLHYVLTDISHVV